MKLPQFCKTPNLKITLVSAMLATIGATVAIVYLPWAMISKRNIDMIIAQVNQEISLATSQEVERLFASAQSAQQLIQSSFTQDFIDLSNQQAQEAFFLSALEANPNFTWIQLGYANGDFIGVQRTAQGRLDFHSRDWNAQTKTTLSTVRSYRVGDKQIRLVDQQTQAMNPAFYAPQRPWYQNAVQAKGQTAWTVYVYRSTNSPGMDTTITLKKQEKTVGVIGIGIELTQLSDYMRKLQSKQPGEAFILNGKAELIASSDTQEVRVSEPTYSSQLQLKQLSAAQNPLLQYADQTLQTQQVSLGKLESQRRFVYTNPQTSARYFISFSPVGHLDWVVGTVIPEANYLGEINRNKQILLIVIGPFILLTAGLSILAVDRVIARPILKVAHAAADMETENFEQESLFSVAQRTDELGQLARVFQTMARQIYMREQTLKQQVQELRIEINETKRQKQVKEIVESDFFQDLASRAQTLRSRNAKSNQTD
ncbi:HAMP domain-containing protein [Rivularia sp. UHCC 0363]|uniref:HAMP domain-containing protein n=1 Tax=Rivularia sp. UHCC 0363 TaxID=3110244 RepID=UPI002B208EC6|nr:HAMP domain-containing protein [Rivularia sp. UHCC 0363]MEA5597359.1 HAMP domain-containing protein [Rivularia sp. UHCC 0363]